MAPEVDDEPDIDVTGGEQDDDSGQDDTGTAGQGGEQKPTAKPEKPADPKAADSVRRAEYNSLAAQLRTAAKQNKQLQDQLDKLTEANASEAEKAVLQARKEASEAEQARWRPQIVGMRADLALAAAGCADADERDLLLSKVDRGAVELDDKGNVVAGLAEQVEALKARYPKMFAPSRPARVPSAREVDAGDKKPPAVKPKATDELVRRLTGGR